MLLMIVIWSVVLFGYSSIENNEMEEIAKRDKVLINSQGTSKEITQADEIQQITQETIRLFAQADNIYLKSISPSDIKKLREDKSVEVLFAQPKKITIHVIKQEKTIYKILIPLGKSWCEKNVHIIYGDPDYKPFNMLLNSKGCKKLQEIINKKNSE
jgi:DNA-binding transcriptional regulator YiaG